ncbi:Uncharacterised protein [Bordetella pertussis]|nr:Uncharacterised protein [Bordetella pertussis]CFT87879.1 Uncharacterised protein [Bordetella pertussis]
MALRGRGTRVPSASSGSIRLRMAPTSSSVAARRSSSVSSTTMVPTPSWVKISSSTLPSSA